jgi:hypothetical protein
MDFKLQALGPFLHWLTLIILCIVPVVLAYVVYRLGGLSRRDRAGTQPPAGRCHRDLQVDGHPHIGPLASGRWR